VRYNLQTGGASKGCSFFLSSVVPIFVTAFLYERGLLQGFCEWVAVAIQGYVNFVIPPLLYRKAILRYGDTPIKEEKFEFLLPFSYHVAIEEEHPADDMDSAQSGTPRVVEETPLASREGKRNALSALFQTVHFWAHKRFQGFLTARGKSIRIAHDSVRSLGNSAAKDYDDKMIGRDDKQTVPSISQAQLPSHSHWNPATEPLLGECARNGDDDVDDEPPKEEPEICAVYPWMGMNKLFWANTLVVGLGILCTLAVLLTVYNSLDNALDDDDQDF